MGLLRSVFGSETATGGIYDDDFGGSWVQFAAGNATFGIGYIDFAGGTGGSLFVESIIINGTKLSMSPDYDPYWSSHVRGGPGYDPSSWAYAQEGVNDRVLGDLSWDGWTLDYSGMADTGPLPGVGDARWSLVSSLNGIAVYAYVVPEPGRLLLLGGGFLAVLLRRRRAGFA